ncbi:MAG: HlyD family type I secretion periplasmic adaptor subunit [bacterium]|nr:HlyD family type I secretion periplasmic adaptor subunit [bacterium]
MTWFNAKIKEESAGQALPPGLVTSFQPSLMALENTPPNPLGRKVVWALAGFLGLLLLGSFVFSVDEVAIAQGKLIPSTYLKVVQPAEQGIVRDILVREGDEVKAGQVLMRMDAAISDADNHSVQAEYESRRWQLQRIDAQLKGVRMPASDGVSPEIYRQALTQYTSSVQAYEAQSAQEEGALEKATQELSAAEEVRSKLLQMLPTYEEREQAFNKLVEKGYVSKIDQIDRKRERIEKQQDLRTQEFTIKAAQAVITQSHQRIRQIQSDYHRQLQAERAEAAIQFEKLAQELSKSKTRHGWLELKAPQDGIVKDISTHTTGTVVSAGTVLLTLVPQADNAVAEVWVSNEDSGFVREGQKVKVKLSSYTFQKYGMVNGIVDDISADASDQPSASAEQDNSSSKSHQQPSSYRARIHLDTQYLEAKGEHYSLRPGMQVVAEIRLGQRKVIEYLLSPITGTVQEAGRER